MSGPSLDDSGDYWLVTFRRLAWSAGAVLVEAESEKDARRIVAREFPDRADKARVRPAPAALVIAAQGRAPLSRGGMPILRGASPRDL